MNPPLRSEDDRQALIDGLRTGTIDCIATDHAPHAREEKEVPFEEAPMGTTGLETAFAAVYTDLVKPGVLPLALVVEKLSAGAALMDLPTPTIEVGKPARPGPDRPRRRVGGRRGGLRVALGELLLRGPHAVRQGRHHDRRRRRSSTASASLARGAA